MTENQSVNRRLIISLCVTLAFVVVEASAGLFSRSLALLTDAAHNLTDVLALALSWWALRLATRPADSRRTFGHHRAGILVALLNSTTLAVVAVGIFYEAYRRFLSPPQVEAGVMSLVAFLAVLVNLVTALMVRRGSEHDLNLRSAFVHLMGDVFSTIGALVAGVIIFFTRLNWIDPLVSVLIGLFILYNAWGIVRESINILMEGMPVDIDVDKMLVDMQSVQGVFGVHDLHIWSINQAMRSLSAHIVTKDIHISVGGDIQSELCRMLEKKYNIAHATLQLECAGCNPTCQYSEPLNSANLTLKY